MLLAGRVASMTAPTVGWGTGLLLLQMIRCSASVRPRSEESVVLDEQSAASFLSRHLLYNSFDFEMLVQGDLERECREEICTYEEAREVFEDDTLGLKNFWAAYTKDPSSLSRVDVSGLVAGILGVVVCAVVAAVLGVYCYKNKKKNDRTMPRTPVRMEGDGGPVPEMVPLSGIIAPPLPSYGDALQNPGQHDAPPPPYSAGASSASPQPADPPPEPTAPAPSVRTGALQI
uniref:Proline rich Gla (G-carboxyglutamic acid) 2 n=1 Tax=Oryzias latipes TaxID=8090 RepID=A0A3P9HP60_ORYLA